MNWSTRKGSCSVSRSPGGEPRRRVLLIAFYYPPAPAVGALRPAGLAKYLGEFGWDATVLTPAIPQRQPQANVIETGYRDVKTELKRKLHLDGSRSLHDQLGLPVAAKANTTQLHTRAIRLIAEVLTYPDPSKGWVPFAKRSVADLAREHRIDAIISTAPPFITHVIGAEAKQLLGCPWIADYRDLWNTDQQTTADATGVMAAIRRRTERNVLQSADMLVTVSDAWSSRLQQRFPTHAAGCVSNGFDEDHFAAESSELTPTFTISHAGQLYEGRRDPTMLLETIHELISEGKLDRSDVRLRFYGPREPFFGRLVSKLNLAGVVEDHGPVGRQEAIRIQRESQVLLLLTWSHPTAVGWFTAKIYEYLASRRPVIAFGPVADPCLVQLLEETGAGMFVTGKAELRRVLLDAYGKFRQQGEVPYHGNSAMLGKYTHREMARKYASLLESLCMPVRTGSTLRHQEIA